VAGDREVDTSKAARNKQLLDKHMSHMAVSRPPVLSAIEEGNTIRSVKVRTGVKSMYGPDFSQGTYRSLVKVRTGFQRTDLSLGMVLSGV